MRTRLLVIQATPLCNLNCSYCYLPDRKNSSRISRDVLKRIFEGFFRSSLSSSGVVEILWHAGEPLAAGLDFFEEAFQICRESSPSTHRVIHSLQTNATLVNKDWADFFALHRVNVGVSLDGPSDIHDSNRKTWNGSPTHAKVMHGIGMLRDAGLRVGAIAVVTAASILRAREIYHFFRNEKFQSLALNAEEVESENRVTSLRINGKDVSYGIDRYRRFISELADAWIEDDFGMAIREFDRYMDRFGRLREDRLYVPETDELRDAGIITVTADGKVSTYSPELATNRHGHYAYQLGSVWDHENFDDFFVSPLFMKIREEVLTGVYACARECEYYGFCGGGSPSNKVSEHGTAAVSKTYNCSLHVQAVIDVLLDKLSSLGK